LFVQKLLQLKPFYAQQIFQLRIAAWKTPVPNALYCNHTKSLKHL
jgi:hypothetical protein